jgi:hypothetical protein
LHELYLSIIPSGPALAAALHFNRQPIRGQKISKKKTDPEQKFQASGNFSV